MASGKGTITSRVLENRVAAVLESGTPAAPVEVADALRRQFAALYQRKPQVRIL